MASVDLQEKAYFTRLARLLVDKGTEALRNTFDAIHSPANLQAVLAANKTSLLKLKPRVINNPQWDLLFPPPGNLPDSKTFDVTLLTVLFRNICGFTAPSTGWGAMPPDTDRSMQANIVRLKLFRNEIYAHVTSTQVDNATFESLWQKISQALIELNIPKHDVDDLKTCSLGPEEGIYVETLKEWKSQEEESMKMLECLNDNVKSMEYSINRLTQITEDNCNEAKQLRQSALEQERNIEALQSSIAQEEVSIKMLECLRNDVKSMECSVNRLTQITEDNCDEAKQLRQSALEQERNIEALQSSIAQEDSIKKLECLNNDVKSMEYSINRLTQIIKDNCDEAKQLRQSALKQQRNIEALQSSIMCLSQVSKDTNLESNCDKKSDENLLQKLAKHSFKSKIRSKGKLFLTGTRKWLLKKVEQFAKREEESRMLLLTAGPGFGKSVFAAKICEDFKMKGKLAASHFCDFSNSNLRDPMMMLQSLASQMCENITGFKEKLLDQLRRPHQVQSLKDAFGIYLQNPLDELDLEEPSLVVIDGLDESAADNKHEIINLITDYFQDLPKCIKFLVTSRPEISVAKLSGAQKIDIDSNDANNNSDLELYLKACLPSLADRKAEIPSFQSVCEKLAIKCEGSFLYAFYVQSELRKRDDLHKMTSNEIMEFVPEGLDSIYLKYFNRLEDELRAIMDGNIDVLRILEMLAVSEDFLPLGFISRALGLAPDCRKTRRIIDKVNETVSCLLYVSDDLVTVFHKSVVDWLLAKRYKYHEYTVKVMDGNKSLWLICEKVFEEIKETVSSGQDLHESKDVGYALLYGFHYLESCMMEKSLFWSVDIVIIYVFLTMYHESNDDDDDHIYLFLTFVLKIWRKIVQLDPVVVSNKLQECLSWHIVEIGFFLRVDKAMSESAHEYYLQSVLTHSPEGCFSDNEKKIAESLLQKLPRFVECFSDNEKKIAESLLQKVPRFVECNFNEVEVLPLAAWTDASDDIESLKAVGLSHDKTMAAVVVDDIDEIIRVISVPSLVELWHFSLDCISISCCLFAPDDSFILFGELQTVLSIAERKKVPFFHGNEETFTSCAFSPNGKRLVTSDKYDDTIKLWDVSRQSLLASLCADEDVVWCSFNSTGLFIIGYSKDVFDVVHVCVWNAITWQRSDQRNIRDVKLKEPAVFQDKKCKRCFRPGFKELNFSKRLVCMPVKVSGDKKKARSAGTYNGVECSFSFKDNTLSVIENTHFTTLAAWNLFVHISNEDDDINCYKLTTIEDDLWFYADAEKLFVFRTSAPTHQQSSRLPSPARVLSSSFSPDASRLATCTSDGCINIWNVKTGQVDQRFKSNQGDLPFACWWSEKFLFVFHFFDRIPSLSKYRVDVNLKIMFPQSKQVSLSHLLEEFVSLSAIVDFSEGLLSFECGKMKPVKVVDVSGVGGPRMVTLPKIKPRMSITVSPGASYVFGGNKSTYYIWKRNAKKEPDVYKVFKSESCTIPEYDDSDESSSSSESDESSSSSESYSESDDDSDESSCSSESYSKPEYNFLCCFSNDCKVAGFFDRDDDGEIFDLDTGDQKTVKLDEDSEKIFCLNKDRVVIAAKYHYLEFYDMDSGAHLRSSFQRYLTRDSLKQLKLSPKETMMAFPKINGDMEFLRLCIPQSSVLSSIKREAANKREERR